MTMSAPTDYLGYFTGDEFAAVHEAGHAVAAIRADWRFSHIELTDPDNDDDEKWRRQAGEMVWDRDREKAWDKRTPLYEGWNRGDERIRRYCIILALAGAVAERLLCEWYDSMPFPSAPDVGMLAEVGHYPHGTRHDLYSWSRYDLRKTDPDLESRLDSIFAPDLPMVEAFVIENQRAIGDVANELWHRTWQRPDGESWRDLPYDEIRKLAV